jgi:hypothetical protein
MTPREATVAVIDALGVLQIPYMLVGSLSCSYYAIPRSTQDADFVVQLEAGKIETLMECLGPEFQLDRQMSFETVSAPNRYKFQLLDSAFVIELFLLGDDPHDQQRFARRRQARIFDREVAIPTAEDVIVTKLRWSQAGQRRKDIEDAENVIAVQRERIDWDYVAMWCERHGTRELLERARQFNAAPRAARSGASGRS